MAMIPPHVGIAFGDLPQKLNEHGDDIPVPREILVRLLDLYISCWDFDEDWYLSTYPDVEEAVRAGKCRVRLGPLQIRWVSGRAPRQSAGRG